MTSKLEEVALALSANLKKQFSGAPAPDRAANSERNPTPMRPGPFPLPDTLKISTANKIICEVCEARGVRLDELLGKRRNPHILAVRYEAVRRVWNETQLSSNQIGHVFNRDHTTIMDIVRNRSKANAASLLDP